MLPRANGPSSLIEGVILSWGWRRRAIAFVSGALGALALPPFSLFPLIIIAVANSNPARATAFAAYIQIVRLAGSEIGIALMAERDRAVLLHRILDVGKRLTQSDAGVMLL